MSSSNWNLNLEQKRDELLGTGYFLSVSVLLVLVTRV